MAIEKCDGPSEIGLSSPSGEWNRRRFIKLSAAAVGAACAMQAGGIGARSLDAPAPPLPDLPPMLADRGNRFRSHICINAGWKFQFGDDQRASQIEYADGEWQNIGLPHSFSLPYFRSTEFYVGTGWYRRVIVIPVDWVGKKISLEFEAAFQEAKVYVNGQAVGGHTGGFTSFNLDISHMVRTGANVLAVRVNNVWNPEVAPRAGDHLFDGGIYRNVWLSATDSLHMEYQGVRITTPRVSQHAAIVKVQTRVTNDSRHSRRCTVLQEVINPQGVLAAEFRSVQTIGSGESRNFVQHRDIANPDLWHPDHPHLYHVRTTIFDDDRPVDQQSAPLGFRWFKWTAEQGLFLNGRHVWIHGANVHQDHAGWASGATDAAAWRDVRMVKEAGFNFIRTSHYPHSRAFMEACDYYGVLIWSEMCFWGVGGFGPDGNWRASAYPVHEAHWSGFEKSCLDQLGEMIAMHRNHPCIIAWSMCNEVFFTNPKVFGRMKNLLRQMVRRTHQLDPSRPAGIGGAQRGGVDKLGDIAGYNGDGATLYLNPGFPSMVTEYGSVAATRPGPYQSDFGALQSTKFAWRSGISIWCAFDYGTWIGMTGEMGIIDYYRLPKRAWYWYRQHNRRIPPPRWPGPGRAARLHLVADRQVIHGTDAIEDSHIVVTVLDERGQPISDSPPVRLWIESGPGEFPTGLEIMFSTHSDICIRDGAAAIEFRSYHAGESVIRASSPGLEPAFLHITTTGEPVFVPGRTPRVANRPYLRSPEPNQKSYMTDASGLINLALNRPTEASSSKPGHAPRFVNDGNQATFWQAARNNPGQWCQVDLEGGYTISEVKVTFPDKDVPRHDILISADGQSWQRAAAGHQSVHHFKPSFYGRFVRIVIQHVPAGATEGISEIAVYGHHGDLRHH